MENNFPNFLEGEFKDGEIIEQKVEYENALPRCGNCVSFGHIDSKCPMVEVWKIKEDKIDDTDKKVVDEAKEIEKEKKNGSKKRVSFLVDKDGKMMEEILHLDDEDAEKGEANIKRRRCTIQLFVRMQEKEKAQISNMNIALNQML